MIELSHVSRWYGQVLGVNDITCTIGPGITALLGVNGAGKSTLLRLITGQLKPTTGICEVFGMEPFANREVYRRIGYCPEIDNFIEELNGFQFVTTLARLGGMSKPEAQAKAAEAIAEVGMTDRAHRAIGGYSKGMRQRIKLAQAMVHDPDIVLLDEPLNGLDPVARYEFLQVLARLERRGKTILVCSHILHEVEQMTRSILLLHRGRLLATGDLSTIREMIDVHPHKIKIETPEPRRLATQVLTLPNVISAHIDERRQLVTAEVRNPQMLYDALVGFSTEQQLPILGFSSPDENLEAVFGYLVGGSLK